MKKHQHQNIAEKLILVNDVGAVGKFFETLLDVQHRDLSIHSDPVTFGLLHVGFGSNLICEKYNLILIERGSCPSPASLSAFSSLAQTRFYVRVRDVKKIQKNLVELGGVARILEDSIGFTERDYILIEGPEKILIHVFATATNPTANNLNTATTHSGTDISPLSDSDKEDDDDSNEDIVLSCSHEIDDDFYESQIDYCEYIVNSICNAFGQEGQVGKTKSKRKNNSGSGSNNHVIPTVGMSLLSDNSRRHRPFPPNSSKPIPFETSFFQGIAILACPHKTMDPSFEAFFPPQFKRTFEIQVQGKFKRLPEGEIYVGAEATDKMEMGFMTRTFAIMALKFARSLVPNLHYSFGEDTSSNEDYEIPHLVGPMFPTLDRILETDVGEAPPTLGIPFEEPREHILQRKKFKSIKDANISLEKIYSFSVNTDFIDLPNWKFVNIPMCKPSDLRDFFGDSGLRLVAYEVPTTVLEQNTTHPQRLINYVFNITLNRVEPGLIDLNSSDQFEESEDEEEIGADHNERREEEDHDHFSVNENEEDDTRLRTTSDADIDMIDFDDINNDAIIALNQAQAKSLTSTSELPSSPTSERSIHEYFSSEDEEDGERRLASSKVKYREASTGVSSKSRSTQQALLSEELQSRTGSGGVNTGYMKSLFQGIRNNVPVPHILDIPETIGDYTEPVYENETTTSLRYCPAIIEIFDHRKKATQVMYLMPYNNGDASDSCNVPRLRSYDDIYKKLQMVPIPKLHKNRHFVSIEKKRRQIVESYKFAVELQSSTVHDLLNSETSFDEHFLTHNAKSFPLLSHRRLISSKQKGFWDGSVALALGNRHWIEYYMIITAEGVSISLHQGSRQMWIPFQSMIRAREMKPYEIPFQGYSFMCIETLRKIYYFIVKDDNTCKLLLKTLNDLGVTEEKTLDKSLTVEFEEFFPTLIFKSRMEIWKLGRRRLYNCRRLIFTTSNIPAPCELVESLLAKALKLSEIWTRRVYSLQDDDAKYELFMLWFDFLDQLSYLQMVDTSNLNELEKTSLYLNLYHVMVIHGSLVLFPPQTSSNWQPFFHDVAYLFSTDVLSIADVEHNVIKAKMTKPPRQIIGLGRNSQAPKSIFLDLALNHRDFRFNFCINNGSVSSPNEICIYKAETLDEQMDHMTSLSISSTIGVDVGKRQVSLPVVCSWFAPDFVSLGSLASPIDCLRAVALYSNVSDRSKLTSLLLSGSMPSIKYKTFTFKSRPLVLLKEKNGNVDEEELNKGEI